MSEIQVYFVFVDFVLKVNFIFEKYCEMYVVLIVDLEVFWVEQGKWLDWLRFYIIVKDVFWDKLDLYVCWFSDGELNVLVNCID